MNNYNYFNYDWYRNSQMNNPSNMNLYAPKEGYEKGNLFSNLYNQYKNYKPATLKPKNERESKLQELATTAFAAHELNLYLDLHPEDQSMLTLFNDYRKKADELTKEFERQYGPLNIASSATVNDNMFAWEENHWPWEVKNV